MMKALGRVFVCAAACVAVPLPALSQSWPVKPIRMIVSQPPGGAGTDLVARLLAQKLGESLGQAVLVENIGGASGMIAAETVAHSPADGYTLLVCTSTQIVGVRSLHKTLAYDPDKDLAPIMALGEAVGSIAVSAKLPVNSVKELVEYSRRNPGKLSYASTGIGSIYHLTGEMFNNAAAVNIVHVPYKGPMQALNDLVAGRIEVDYLALGTVLPYHQQGKVKVLAVLEKARYAGAPDIPTVAESLANFQKPSTFFGLFGPARLPGPLVVRLNTESERALNAPEVRAKLDAAMILVVRNSPQQFAAQIQRDVALNAAAARLAGIRPE